MKRFAKQKKSLLNTPESSDDEVVPIPEAARSEGSSERGTVEEYRDAAYYALPENVRKAVDLAKVKSKHSEFYDKLKNLNDKVGVFTSVFYTRVPKFERNYIDRKRKRLERMMFQEQKQIEDFVEHEKRKHEEHKQKLKAQMEEKQKQ